MVRTLVGATHIGQSNKLHMQKCLCVTLIFQTVFKTTNYILMNVILKGNTFGTGDIYTCQFGHEMKSLFSFWCLHGKRATSTLESRVHTLFR